MLDIKRIREDYEGVKAAVEKRCKGDFGLSKVPELDAKRREVLAEVEQMKNRQNCLLLRLKPGLWQSKYMN